MRICCIILLITASHLPALAETPFHASERFIAAGQITEARRALQSELRMHPNNIEARYNLALLLQEIHHFDEASRLYKHNLSIAWHLPSVVNLANILEQQGNKPEAIAWLKKASKALKFEAAPWYILATIAEQQGEMTKADSYYHKAIKADPLNGFAWLRLAIFQAHLQHLKQAIKHAAKAMRLLPNCAPCWQTYGNILEQHHANTQAIKAYQHGLSIHPTPQTRKQLINALHKLKDHTDNQS